MTNWELLLWGDKQADKKLEANIPTSLGYSLFNSLQWRHNGHDGVSNHQPHHCLLNRLFGCRSKKTSKLHVTGLCAGNSPGTGEFLVAQMAGNAENVSIWWRHHAFWSSDTKWYHTASSLIQAMANCQFSTKALLVLLLSYYQLDTRKNCNKL